MATNLVIYDTWRDFVADPTRAAAAAGTLKFLLVTSAYTPNQNTDEFVTTPIASEVTGTGYTARGNACGSPSWTGPDGSGVSTFDANDPATWTQNGAGFTNARRGILYYDTGTNSTSRLVAYTDDYGANLSNVGADLAVQFNASGIYTSPR